MEKWILVVRSNCVDYLPGEKFSDEEKFNDWYDNYHLPDVLKAAGFVSAKRFVNPDISTRVEGKYLAIYEIETDDIGKSMESLGANLQDVVKAGRYSSLLDVRMVTLYKQITHKTKA